MVLVVEGTKFFNLTKTFKTDDSKKKIVAEEKAVRWQEGYLGCGGSKSRVEAPATASHCTKTSKRVE